MELVEVETPSSTERKVGAGHQILSPVQLIMFYPPAEWEQFIFEWVTARRGFFAEVKRLGGAGDRGIDIAHLRTAQGLDGDWDCYQCKHYENAVNWSGILPELVKVFRHSARGDYTFPSKYVIVAPKGVSTDLENTLNSPERMRARFLDDLAKHWHEDADYDAIVALASRALFDRFTSANLLEILDEHARTRWHSFRFGTALPARSAVTPPPTTFGDHEMPYLTKLLDVYREQFPEINTLSEAEMDKRTRTDLQKHRVRFFKAEELQSYARDSVPEGVYEAFKSDIYDGVYDVFALPDQSGRQRLTGVLTAAGQLNLMSHLLHTRAEQDDIKGACHQLANEDQLWWVEH